MNINAVLVWGSIYSDETKQYLHISAYCSEWSDMVVCPYHHMQSSIHYFNGSVCTHWSSICQVKRSLFPYCSTLTLEQYYVWIFCCFIKGSSHMISIPVLITHVKWTGKLPLTSSIVRNVDENVATDIARPDAAELLLVKTGYKLRSRIKSASMFFASSLSHTMADFAARCSD